MDTIKKLKYYLLLLWLTPAHVLAADTILGELGDKDAQPADSAQAIVDLITRLQNIVFGVAGGVAVTMIIWGAIILLTASGNEERVAKGKKILTYAIGGVVLIVASYALIAIFIRLLGGKVS